MAKRFPAKKEILQVYAMAVFCLYAWTLVLDLWRLPSWRFFLTPWEIFSNFAYGFALNLLESLLLLGGLLLLAFLLPAKCLRDDFVARGALCALCPLLSIALHLAACQDSSLRETFIRSLPLWWGGTAVLTALAVWLLPKISRVRAAILDLADRLTVFLYLFLPLSCLSLIVALARNLG